MAKGQRLKPEQIVTLLRQIDVLTTNGKTLAQACKEVGTVEQSYYRWRKIYGGMKVDQARKYKDLELENTRLKKLVADLSLREVMLKEVIKGTFYALSAGNPIFFLVNRISSLKTGIKKRSESLLRNFCSFVIHSKV